jgi:PAS domain S-box-containing protein
LLARLEFQNTRLQLQIEQLQKAQKESDNLVQRLQSLHQYVSIAYLTLDTRGQILDWNAAAADLLDGKRYRLGSLPLTFFVARADFEIFLEHLLRCKKSRNEQVVSELRLRTRRGILPIQLLSIPQASGKERLFQTALLDLTERKKNERALREAKEFSDAIIQTIHEPLLVLDSNLKILRLNAAAVRLFKAPSAVTRGRSVETMLNLWWSGNELRTRLERCLRNNEPVNNFELEVQLRQLGRRTFVFNACRLLHKENCPPVLLVALEDITARKEAENQLGESNQKLQQLNNELEKRVEERTRQLRDSNTQLESFCYSIAHDLRAPLRSMAGFGMVLEQQFAEKLGPRGLDFVKRIIAAGNQMDQLIHDLLEYGRFNTTEIAPMAVDADEVLREVLQDMQPAIKEAGANVECKSRLPVVVGHGVALAAAFSNLLSNALKFVPPERPPRVTIWPEERENEVSICIADNGIGIDRQHHARIFEVFHRLHTQGDFPGTGIGLAIVSKAVERMGGHVGVESEPGKGSRFWINLPRAQANEQPAR